MNQHLAARRSRLTVLALAAVLGLALVALTQCRSITDTVTGVDLRTAGSLSVRSSCQRHCNSQFKAGLIAEEIGYQKAKRACVRDYVCKKLADREHSQNVRELLQAKKRCKHSCYNEGAGSGA